MAAIAAGADSLMIEVHPNPDSALSDGSQSLTLERYEELIQEMAVIGKAVGRWLKTPVAIAKLEATVSTSRLVRSENRCDGGPSATLMEQNYPDGSILFN